MARCAGPLWNEIPPAPFGKGGETPAPFPKGGESPASSYSPFAKGGWGDFNSDFRWKPQRIRTGMASKHCVTTSSTLPLSFLKIILRHIALR